MNCNSVKPLTPSQAKTLIEQSKDWQPHQATVVYPTNAELDDGMQKGLWTKQTESLGRTASGDLGQSGAPLTRYSSPIDTADAVFLESTYGDRNHRSFKETFTELTEIVRRASQQGGKILVPTFAVGRAQTLVVLLAWLFREKEVKPSRYISTVRWRSRPRRFTLNTRNFGMTA